MPATSITPRCPRCQAAVPPAASEGLCPACLVAGVLTRHKDPTPDSHPEDPDINHPPSLGNYQLDELIAQGGMGIVYRTRDKKLNREVALKVIRAGQFAAPEEVRRFRFEAEAAARLDHPNIVPIYEIGQSHGRHFFTMKLVEGGCLADALQDSKNLPQDHRRHVQLLSKITRAVQYAHERGILHRDLKPSNILLDQTGEPHISDFGLAKLAQTENNLTLTGTVVGTPSYMAPEQATATQRHITTASDIYSLGAILYQLLTGQPPFQADTPLDTLRQLVENDPPRPSSLNPRIDRDLETICLKCLEKKPANRYRSAGSLADDLERWTQGKPIHARPNTLTERLVKWVHRKPALAALSAVSTLAALSFVVLLMVSDARLTTERNYALQQEARARSAASLAATNEFITRLHLYAADLSLAQAAITEGNLGAAQALLKRGIPQPGQADHRGFEWYYLQRQSQGNQDQILRQHSRAVTCLQFTHDGSLVSAGRDGTACFWNLNQTQPTDILPGVDIPKGLPEDAVLAGILAVSPEALAMIASGADTYSGVTSKSRPSTLGDVRTLALSPNGKWLASGSLWSYVRVWNLESRKLAFVIPAYEAVKLEFTHDSQQLVFLNQGPPPKSERTLKIYRLNSHHRTRNEPSIANFSLAPSGSTIAVSRHDGRVELLNLINWTPIRSWNLKNHVQDLAFSNNGKQLAILHPSENRIILAQIKSGKTAAPINLGTSRPRSLTFSPDDRLIATAGGDHSVRLWNVQTGKELGRLRGHADQVLAAAFSPDGRFIATGSEDHSIRIWSIPPRSSSQDLERIHRPAHISADGRIAVSHTTDNQARIHDLESFTVAALPGTVEQVIGLLDQDDTVVTFTAHNTTHQAQIQFWNLQGEPSRDPFFLPWPDPKAAFAGSTTAELAATAPGRGQVYLYSLRDGQPVRRLSGPRRPFHQLRFSADGSLLAAYTWPNTLSTWDTASGQHLAEWKIPESTVTCMTFAPDNISLATGGDDNVIRLWNPSTAEPTGTLRGHKAELKALTYTPDGRTLASASGDRTVRLWHLPTHRELGIMDRGNLITYLQFAAAPLTLYAGEHSHGLHRFPSNPLRVVPSPPPNQKTPQLASGP